LRQACWIETVRPVLSARVLGRQVTFSRVFLSFLSRTLLEGRARAPARFVKKKEKKKKKKKKKRKKRKKRKKEKKKKRKKEKKKKGKKRKRKKEKEKNIWLAAQRPARRRWLRSGQPRFLVMMKAVEC
jgi:FKBP-type peptidyl-prolyl cis-trans isomerase